MMRLQILFVGVLISGTVQALTSYVSDLVCPIGGEPFKAVLAGSGTSFGKFLDFKPYGPIAAPWPLAKWPSNGFVMFQNKFSQTELGRLDTFVTSDAYKKMKNVHTNYYLAAALQRQIGAPPSRLAYTLLQATWEASDSLYIAYATEALEAFISLIGAESPNSKPWVSYQLIAGELERRLKKFDAAADRFSELQDNSDLDPNVKGIIEFQRLLISERNSTEQPMPSAKK